MDLEKRLTHTKLAPTLQNIRKFCLNIWEDRYLPWFTNHDADHSVEIIKLLGQILDPLKRHDLFLNDHELFILLASAYLHDIGMQHLKVSDVSADSLTEKEYDEIRKFHSEKSAEIVLKKVAPVLERDDYHFPDIDDEYLPAIARVVKGHSTAFFENTVLEFTDDPLTPANTKIRGEFLTALLMIGDELDLHCQRVDFKKKRQLNLSDYSWLHWYKHHYVDFVEIEKGQINITLRFPGDADNYSALIRELIESKLVEQLEKVNPILLGATDNFIRLNNPAITVKMDTSGVKRPLPVQIIPLLKKEIGGNRTEKIEDEDDESDFESMIPDPPKPTSFFTGRTKEMDEFKRAFDDSCLVAVQGLGGIGKTELAAKFVETFPKERVVWFDCLPESKLDSLITQAGFPEVIRGEKKTELARYAGFTDLVERHKKILVLDDFQNLEDDSFEKFLAFAGRRIGNARIVIVSRQHPNVPDVDFESITLPGLEGDAINYAKRLIRAKHKNLGIGEAELTSVCSNIDGHPLAIRLAVQLLDYGEPPENIIQAIVSTKDRGEDLSRRLLNDIFEHSESSRSEIDFMLHFSVFRRPVSRMAIDAIVEFENAATLYTLIDKFMITRSNGSYTTHPLIREFCYKRLENKTHIHRKRAKYLENSRTDTFDPALEEDIFYHLERAEDYEDCGNLIVKCGEQFILTGNTNSLKLMLDSATSNGIGHPEFLLFNGDISYTRGEWDDALSFFQKAFSQSVADAKVRAEGLIKYGEMLYRRGKVRESVAYFEQGLEICQSVGYRKYEARGLNDIGLAYDTFGNLETALEKYNKSLEIQQEIGNRSGIAVSLNNIGSVYQTKGDLKSALDNFKESLNIVQEIGNRSGIAVSLNSIGMVYQAKGDLKSALDNFKESLNIVQEIGDRSGIISYLNNIGSINHMKGNTEEAMENVRDSLKISEETQNMEGIITGYLNIGVAYSQSRDHNQGLKHIFMSQSLQNKTGINKKVGTKESLNQIRRILKKKKMTKLAKDVFQALPSEYKQYLSEDEVLNMINAQNETQAVGTDRKVGRNEPCPCGNGKKYKKCCGKGWRK